MARKIKNIIIHCSMSGFGDAAWIKNIHVNENGWRDNGYNGIILNGHRTKDDFKKDEIGMFEIGRGLDLDQFVSSEERAAHALGYNKDSLGICMIGVDKFYSAQFKTALHFCFLFLRINPKIKIIGHYECERTNKTCPNFPMGRFRQMLEMRYFNYGDIPQVMEGYIKNV